MQTRIIEAVVGQALWSTFLVGIPDTELRCISQVDGARLFRMEQPGSFMLFDLFTKEGAWFSPVGYARHDIQRHSIWTSPLFEPFLTWLRAQFKAGVALNDLPALVEFPMEQATSSERHGGPMDALVKIALQSTDKAVQTAAKALWAATYGSPAPHTPLTLTEAKQWLGSPLGEPDRRLDADTLRPGLLGNPDHLP